MLVVQVRSGGVVVEFTMEGHSNILEIGSKKLLVDFGGETLTFRVGEDEEIVSASEKENK